MKDGGRGGEKGGGRERDGKREGGRELRRGFSRDSVGFFDLVGHDLIMRFSDSFSAV